MSVTPTPVDRSTVSRASVVRGLAWSLPAVAAVAAAPMAAASPILTYAVTFTSNGGTAYPQGPGAGNAPTLPVTIAPTAGLTANGSSLTVTGERTATFSFDRPVTNLSFTVSGLTFVDNNGAAGVRDTVSLSPVPGTVLHGGGAVGAGSGTSPLTGTSAIDNGTAKVTFAGPIQSVTLTLSSNRGKATPSIDVLGMTFSADAGATPKP